MLWVMSNKKQRLVKNQTGLSHNPVPPAIAKVPPVEIWSPWLMSFPGFPQETQEEQVISTAVRAKARP